MHAKRQIRIRSKSVIFFLTEHAYKVLKKCASSPRTGNLYSITVRSSKSSFFFISSETLLILKTSSYYPGCRVGLVARLNFVFCSYRKCQLSVVSRGIGNRAHIKRALL